MSTITLKPGLLVSLKTSLRGGITYERVDLEKSGGTEDSPKVEKWNTTKVTIDPVEAERAVKVRGKLRSLISGVCVPSNFGLLCPVAKEAELIEAIKESREMAALANAGFVNTRVAVFVMVGRIAESDAEAARAVASELRDLFDEMESAITDGDVVRMRAAANKARPIVKMLDNGAAGKATAAIAEVRETATEITKRLTKQESIATYLTEVKLRALPEAREAFLDLDDDKPMTGTPLATVQANAPDLDDEDEESKTKDEDVPADDKGERKAASS